MHFGQLKRRELISSFGGAVALLLSPHTARSQQSAMPLVGFLHPASAEGYAHIVAALRQGLAETGHVDGRNLTIEYRWAEDHFDRLPALAAELVRQRVAVIVTGGMTTTAAVHAATKTIPIVFSAGSDPVKAGLVASINRPGGNATGLLQFNDALLTKRLEMMRELVPKAGAIGVLVDPLSRETDGRLALLIEAARGIGQDLRVLRVTSQEQFDEVFALAKREGLAAILVSNGTVFTNGRARLVAAAARYALPASYEYREFVGAGGLLSYGASHTDEYRQVGVYAGRVLKGEKPADMPVVQTAKFELVINLKTAKALGLTVPSSLLVAADEVIE
jgi:putative tryptophan/tyrosine transport system substrate-binding protein